MGQFAIRFDMRVVEGMRRITGESDTEWEIDHKGAVGGKRTGHLLFPKVVDKHTGICAK